MLKKVIVCILILVTVLSPVISIQAYANENLSYEGEICRDLGMLKGETGIVDAAYLRTKPSRLQSAIMFLRLRGLENRALSYEGDRNFSDARTMVWPQGRNILCYLKEHPELGWIGDGTNFRPFELIDAQAYYKVMLEALGYKQVVDGGGDFKWSEVLAFAAEKGLKKAAQDEVFTVNSLAIATVEALKTNTKDNGKKLIYNMVESGLISKRKATELQLYSDEINIGVKNVKPLSNSKIEVEFSGTPDAYTVENTDNYKLSYKGNTVDIKAANMKNETSVVLDTAAMKEDMEYQLYIDGKAYTFKAVRKDTTTPKLISATCKDTDLVELVFDRVLDNISAQDTDNYSIKDIGIRSATLDSTNTRVKLVTNGIQANRSYDLKITNIKNADGVVTKSITKRITGTKDTAPPKLEKLTAVNNIKLILEFSDKNGINKSSAQNRSNYSITSNEGGLDIIEAKVLDRDGDGLWETVELNTEVQTASRNYTLSIRGITDDSVQKNEIKSVKKSFRGKNKDKTSPTVARNPVAITNTLIEVQFSDSNALDVDSACDLSNYEISSELDLIDAWIKNPDDLYSAGGKTVLLRTSEMQKSKSYYLTVMGVMDEFGNELKPDGSSYRKYRFSGKPADNTPPYIVSVDCTESGTIVLGFDDRLDKASAQNTQNYRIDGLDLVTKAKLSDTEKTVTLTVNSLSSSGKYTVVMNNIKDLAGNAMNNVSIKVQIADGGYSLNPAEIDYIEALNEYEIWVHFDGKVRADGAKLVAGGITFSQAGYVLDEGTAIVMKASSRMQDKGYEVTSLTGVRNGSSSYYELEGNLDFYGTTASNEPPEVYDWEQTNIKTFRVIFSEPVLGTKNVASDGKVISGIQNPSGAKLDWYIKINPQGENTNEAYSTVDFTASGKIPDNREFRFNFSEILEDYMGEAVMDDEDTDGNKSRYTILTSDFEDSEKPEIDFVEAVTKTKVQVVFDEAINKAGTYKITYEDNNNRKKTVSIARTEVDSYEQNIVNIITSTELEDDDTLYLLVPVTGASDLAGNTLDTRGVEYEFYGTNIKGSDYIQGIDLIDSQTFEVIKSSKIYNINSVKELSSGGSPENDNLINNTKKINDSTYEIEVKRPLLSSLRYEITIDGFTYRFSGPIENNNITLNSQNRQIEFYNSNTSTQEVTVYRGDYSEVKVNKSNGHFYIDQSEMLKNGDVLYVYVKQSTNSKILYGAKITAEGFAAAYEKKITGFAIDLEKDAEGIIDHDKRTVTVTVPYGTDVTALKPIITTSTDTWIDPGSGEGRDFTNPRTYTVTSDIDKSKQEYIVTVVKAESSEKSILSFDFKDAEAEVDINGQEGIINVAVPYGTVAGSLIPEIRVSEGATVKPLSGEETDFRKPVSYEVNAQDGTTKEYLVTVKVAESRYEKKITRFVIDLEKDAEGIIDEANHIISITVPYGTDLSRLTPIIETSGDTYVTPGSGSENDFRAPEGVEYTVVSSKDTSKQKYVVKVNVQAASSENRMTAFSFAGLTPAVIGHIDETEGKIMLTVPAETLRTNLVAAFTSSPGSTVTVAGVKQESGKTANDFSSIDGVIYTVTAQDGTSVRQYRVIVSIAFGFSDFGIKIPGTEKIAAGVIDQTNRIITVTMPKDTDISRLVAVFRLSDNTTANRQNIGEPLPNSYIVQQSGITENDFSKEVKYTLIKGTAPMEYMEYTIRVVLLPQ
ncbi:MAG: Ig-like domain-containing protein [Clostridiaceae bacterium]|nr:Ig-like domain-containing protein [Clostridiaceae bacterium]